MSERFPEGPVTIVFSDVVGSTDLRTQRGDATAHRILRSHEEVVRRSLAAHEGREVKALGDGFMLAFASVRKALACAVAIQQDLAERNAESPGEELEVRIGVNTGEVVMERDDLYGQAVNAAARIAAKAGGGEILISDIVRQLAGSGSAFSFVDRGEQELKGFPDPWRLFALAFEARRPELPSAGARTPFVGREAERVELRRLLAGVRAGSGAVVLIGGEPGVGKTRIAEELTIRCTRDGFTTFTGHCYEAAGAAPYIPIVETYEQGLAQAPSPQAFRDFLGEEAAQIAKLVPRLRQLCPDIPPPLELPAEQERRFLFNSIWEVLARTARARPTLLVLDDIHWADEPTMLLLQHCAERVAEVPLLMVCLYRDSELDVGRPLSRTFAELTRRRLAQRMPLKRLPADSVAAMLRALAGQEPPASLVEVIYTETEGNAFFTEEVFKHLAEEGRLFDAAGRFRVDLTVDELDVPEGVRLVVGARLQRLGDECPKVLGSAAVLGRVFSFELLRQLEELPEDRLLDLIEEAERAGLVAAVPGADDRYLFAHELIRQTVLSQLSAPRVRRLHARAAEARERTHSSDLALHAAAIAHHLLEAGAAADPKRTFRYLVMAGAHAQETSAFEEALAQFERAAELAEAATPGERADLLYRLGTARRCTGRWEEAIVSWNQAIDAHEAAGDHERAAAICNEAIPCYGWSSRFAEGIHIAQRGLDLLGDDGSALQARLLAWQGCSSAFAAEPFEIGEALIDRALIIADQLSDPSVRGAALSARSLAGFGWMHLPVCADAGLASAELLRAAGNLWEESTVLAFVSIGLIGSGRFPEARQLDAHLEPLAARVGDIGGLLMSRRGRALVAFAERGDLDALEEFGRADLKLCADNGLPWLDHSYCWLGLVPFLRGDWDAARHQLETGAECEPQGNLHGISRGPLFELLAYLGDRKAALAMLDRADDNRLPVAGPDNGYGQWAMLLSAVEGLSILGEQERAAGLYDLVVECLDRTGSMCQPYFDARLIERTAGIAAAAGHRWDLAERHFRTALRQAAELPHLPEQAHTRRFFARMLLDRDAPGDRPEAATLAAEAANLYRRMGMRRHLALVEASP